MYFVPVDELSGCGFAADVRGALEDADSVGSSAFESSPKQPVRTRNAIAIKGETNACFFTLNSLCICLCTPQLITTGLRRANASPIHAAFSCVLVEYRCLTTARKQKGIQTMKLWTYGLPLVIASVLPLTACFGDDPAPKEVAASTTTESTRSGVSKPQTTAGSNNSQTSALKFVQSNKECDGFENGCTQVDKTVSVQQFIESMNSVGATLDKDKLYKDNEWSSEATHIKAGTFLVL